MQSILLLIYPHESVIYKIFYTAVYGAFYGYFKEHSIGFSLRLPMGYSDGTIDRGYSVS